MSSINHYRQIGEQLDDDFEGVRERLRALEERTGQEIDYEELAEILAPMLADNGGQGPSEDVTERFDKLRYDVNLAVNPDRTGLIETGAPSGTMHSFPSWGIIVTVERPVHWRSAEVDAEEAGTLQLTIHSMDYEEGETYDLGPVEKSREIPVSTGRQTIPTEITLQPGQYFITREDSTPMRRVLTDANWSELNDAHDIPLTIECSWQAGRTPDDTVQFNQYLEQGWHRILHYYANLEFGYMAQEG